MSLTLIGIGLFDEKDLSLRAIEEAKNSDKVYIELYTSKWYGNLKNLEKLLGKKVIELKRKDLEENSSKIIEEAKNRKIGILVGGDSFVATTHIALKLEAMKQGIKTRVIHGSSIISAIGETGLHIYKFGPIVTIPFLEKTKGKLPESIFRIIRENQKRGLHTLCLLDVVAEENKYLKVNEGLQILLNGKVVNLNDKIVVFVKAGSEKPLITYDTIDSLVKKNIKDTPAVIIILGKLHFTEKEYLSSYR